MYSNRRTTRPMESSLLEVGGYNLADSRFRRVHTLLQG